jgi:hypothetical protein
LTALQVEDALRIDLGEAREVVDGMRVQLVLAGAGGDPYPAVGTVGGDRDALGLQRPDDLLGEPGRDDHGAGLLDLGVERHAQRQLEIGGGELDRLLGVARSDADARRDLDRGARRGSARGRRETVGEEIGGAVDLHFLGFLRCT